MENILITQLPTITDQVGELHENMMEISNLVEGKHNIANRAVETADGVITTEGGGGGGQSFAINLLKKLWRILTSSYSYLLQWLWPLKERFNFEITKYMIQICGHISYHLEWLDKV